MMRLVLILAFAVLGACAHVAPQGAPPAPAGAALWNEAHTAFYLRDFALADSLFTLLAQRNPDTDEGREARFYLGALRLDPRNPDWSSERAETSLLRYLQQDTIGARVHRRPEAQTLLELARQLNLPPQERVAGLAAEAPPPPNGVRRVAPAAAAQDLQEENDRLRRELAQRDEQIRRQREELDRIRRTLAPRTP